MIAANGRPFSCQHAVANIAMPECSGIFIDI